MTTDDDGEPAHWAWPVLRGAARQGHDLRIGLEGTPHDAAGQRVSHHAVPERLALAG
ncbi:MAG: hypothetical protein M3Y71_18685 [Actinomycetota bacterium]|nr:hypothetical protein [Actinomycetota bacterium]